MLDYINIQDYITSIAYFPSGESIAVGTQNGKCSIYDCKVKNQKNTFCFWFLKLINYFLFFQIQTQLKYSYSFYCKNKIGKYSGGRKITSIEFINRNSLLVSTNDSRVRLVNVFDGKVIQKYKGLVNEEFMLKAYYE